MNLKKVGEVSANSISTVIDKYGHLTDSFYKTNLMLKNLFSGDISNLWKPFRGEAVSKNYIK